MAILPHRKGQQVHTALGQNKAQACEYQGNYKSGNTNANFGLVI